ncbi:MAG: glucose 1-dehydrogenase [Armatimonadota bacterium]
MSLDRFSLRGKCALVTGGGRGLGRAIAVGLAHAGAAVAVLGRRQEALDAAVDEIKQMGGEAQALVGDLSEVAAIGQIVGRAREALGGLDILVNNAGTIGRAPALEFSETQWDVVVDLNLKAVFFASQAAARLMVEAGKGGSIINMASLLSEMGRPTIPSYAASKGGVKQLTKALAVEWAPHGIRVNAIGPGYMETDMTQALRENAELKAWVDGRIPMGRWGAPEDLQGAAVFLASDASSYVTGQTIYVDGGWLAG